MTKNWRDKRPGRAAVAIYVEEAVKTAWQEFVDARNSTLRAEIVTAMARHIASPPPLPEEVPLPPKRPRGRPRKNISEKNSRMT